MFYNNYASLHNFKSVKEFSTFYAHKGCKLINREPTFMFAKSHKPEYSRKPFVISLIYQVDEL